jgi:hypothetical protein
VRKWQLLGFLDGLATTLIKETGIKRVQIRPEIFGIIYAEPVVQIYARQQALIDRDLS